MAKKDNAAYSHELAAEKYLSEGNYEAAEKEFVASGNLNLAAQMWLYEGRSDKATDVYKKAGAENTVGARAVQRAIKAGSVKADPKLGGKKLLGDLREKLEK
jgi:hypothetical protein